MDVLCPVDGSECSFDALSFATTFVQRFDASLDVVHVTDYETEDTAVLIDRARELLDGVDAEPEVVVKAGLDDVRFSKTIGTHLVALVEERGYDHVVMGRHGSGRLERMILGSTSEQVLKTVSVPVTVVP